MSYVVSYHHIIIVTKNRGRTLSHEYSHDLYNYIGAIVKNRSSILFEVNGIEDHIHLLVRLHPTISLADFVKEVKVATSIWMKSHGKFPDFIGWSPKNGAFTKSERDFEMIRDYVRNQKSHHAKIDFINEMKSLMQDEKLQYDEKYFFV